jgi:hypothetical protein
VRYIHSNKIIERRGFHGETSKTVGAGDVVKAKVVATLIGSQVILTVHHTERYPIDSGLFFLLDVIPSHRVLQGAKKLECQAAIGDGLLKRKVKQTNIVAKIIEVMA